MSIVDFFELFFVIAAGVAMPFIVIGSYFNLVSSEERSRPLAIFFLVISIIYALIYFYFSWQSIVKSSDSWKRIVEKKKTEENKDK